MSKHKLPQHMHTCPDEHQAVHEVTASQTDCLHHIVKESNVKPKACVPIKSPTHIVDGEYITKWLVLGPFFHDDLETDFLADLPVRGRTQTGVGGEAKVEPQEGLTLTTADGRTLTWKRYQAKGNIVDLADAIGHHDHATAYAFCVLQSEVATDARIYIGSEDGVAVWINGEQVHDNPAIGPLSLDGDVFEVHLKVGENRCLIKVSHGVNNWGFAVRMDMLPQNRAVLSGMVTDKAGQSIPNADIQLEYDGEVIAETQTDALGSYRLSIYPAPRRYDLSATSGHLGDWQLGIRLDEGEHRILNLKLKESVNIEGTLLMLDDTTPHVAIPVQAIRVCRGDPRGRPVATTLSDESGKYRFINLKPGRYKVRCQILDGYVYYGEEQRDVKTRKRENGKTGESENQSFTHHVSRFTNHATHNAQYGKTLQVEGEKTLSGIDFRFAPFKKGTWKNYTYLDGLADNNVMAIHRNPDGRMWFGTFGGGVSVYDGKTFKNLTTEDGLADNSVGCIHVGPDGAMWFGTRGGVSRYNGSKFTNFTTEDGLPHNLVFCIQADPDGTIWFGTRDGISQYDGKEFTNLTTEDGLAHGRVYAIHRARDGILWFGTCDGVSRYDGETFTNLTTEDGLADNSVRAIYRASDGTIWFGTEDGGVSRYDGKTFTNLTTEDGLADNNIWCIHQDPDGTMWFATFGGGTSRYDGEGLVNFTADDGLANNVQAIHRDEDGILWFGTKDLGVFRYDEREFVSFTTKDGLGGNDATSVSCAPEGVMWFGTYGGVTRYDGKGFVNFTKEDGLAHDWVNAIHCDSDGILWFGTYNGVSQYDGKEFLNLKPRDGLGITAVYVAPDGVLWFGTADNGLYRYDGKTFASFTPVNGLPEDYVYVIHRNPNGFLWFGTLGGGIAVYDGKEFVNLTTKDGLASDIVCAIHCDSDGILWIGTHGGLSRYDGTEFVNFTTKDGLVNNKVTAVHTTPDGLLWLGTFGGGVAVYDGTAWTSLDTRDGLANNVIQGICSDADGSLWFATQGGITRYQGSATTPQAHIISVTTDRAYTNLDAVPAFPVGTRVTIEYGSIDFKTIPEKRQYRYRIYESANQQMSESRNAQWFRYASYSTQAAMQTIHTILPPKTQPSTGYLKNPASIPLKCKRLTET